MMIIVYKSNYNVLMYSNGYNKLIMGYIMGHYMTHIYVVDFFEEVVFFEETVKLTSTTHPWYNFIYFRPKSQSYLGATLHILKRP